MKKGLIVGFVLGIAITMLVAIVGEIAMERWGEGAKYQPARLIRI